MKRVVAWLSVSLLLMLANPSPARAPQPQPGQPAAKGQDLLTAPPLKEDPQDDELRKLMKARYNEALGEVQVSYKLYQSARTPFDSLAGAGQRLLRAGLELNEKPADKVALLTQYVDLAKSAEAVAGDRLKAGRGTAAELHRARYQRLDGEIQLLRARRAADKGK